MLVVRATVLLLGAASATNINFVDVLKHDLRRNNDDYIEATSRNRTSSTATTEKTTASTIHPSSGRPTDASSPAKFNRLFRRRNTAITSPSIEVVDGDQILPIQNPESPHKPKPLNDIVENQTKTAMSTKPNKNLQESMKLEKLKKFMRIHKEELNDFVKKKRMEKDRPVARVGETDAAADEAPTRRTASNLFTNINELMKMLPQTTRNADYLDMAPAEGAEVQALRMKGRLCHRSVMLPEGPKYDSKGKMYLGAFTHRFGRDYSMTRFPKLILPRCCNCCKKSVLGCE